jgi:hypothetical protein
MGAFERTPVITTKRNHSWANRFGKSLRLSHRGLVVLALRLVTAGNQRPQIQRNEILLVECLVQKRHEVGSYSVRINQQEQ